MTAAGVYREREGIEGEWLTQGGDDALGDLLSGGGAAAVGKEHGELVAPDTGNGVGLAQQRRDPWADQAQQFVAVAVAEGVVELLEPVQIDHQNRRDALVTCFGQDGEGGSIVKALPIGEAGQRVEQRL